MWPLEVESIYLHKSILFVLIWTIPFIRKAQMKHWSAGSIVQLFSLSVLSDTTCSVDTPFFQGPLKSLSCSLGWDSTSGRRPSVPFSIALTSYLVSLWALVRSGQYRCPVDIFCDILCWSFPAQTKQWETLPIIKWYFQLLLPLSHINHLDWKLSVSAPGSFFFTYLSSTWFLY